MTFNIAIDGLTTTGKTSIGYSLAKRLNFNFIDSGLFYHYLAYYNINSTNFNQHTYNTLINCSNSNTFSSLDISQKASELSKDEEIRSLINQEIKKLTKEKRFVVVGRDITTNILPDAEFKILLSADFETRFGRRVMQLVEENPQNILYDIITHDNDSKSLINCLKKINFCKRCKKSIDNNFDSESYKSTTLSSITIITEESQKSLKNKGIFDDVIKKYSAKYITSQSGTVENDNIFWSDNEMQMDDKYRLLLSNYSLTCKLEEKYLVALSHLTLVEKYSIPVKETKNAIETQLIIQSNLKKKYKEMITSYEIDSREFSLIVPITSKKQIPISKRINPNKNYFDYYNIPTGKKERDEIYDEYAIREIKEETGITI
ncbi:22218_t:CDS:2 [Dentiscutata erythropus]|uniref:(d)CMP kinase n=1 Tax=Dentiscutata erythropus TaxID=1348616 RepID=A0A9N9IKL9_9GLOM|nr:22218_t:CDS:2 [Dentiscutata erythropus]